MRLYASNELKSRLTHAAANGSVIAADILSELKKNRPAQEIIRGSYNFLSTKRKWTDCGSFRKIRIVFTAFNKDPEHPNFPDRNNPQAPWFPENRTDLEPSTFIEQFKNLREYTSCEINYFRSATDHLLMWQEMSYLSGLDKTWGNGGKLENRGFDVEATGVVWASPSWQWQVGASVGHYKNKVTALPDGQRYMDTEILGATVRTEIGRPANLFYGYKAQGVFSTSAEAQAAGLYIHDDNGVDRTAFEAGDMHFADLDGDHFITEADRMVIGDPNPDIYGNIFTSVQYRRLRLDVRFNYSLGNDIYNYTRQQLESGSRFMNQTTALARRWQMEGQQTDIPRLSFQDPMGNSRFSDRWIEDGSYLRLKTVTLSYDLPVSSTFLQGLQFWVQANNVVTLTRYLGSDPEGTALSAVLGQGIDAGSLPQSRNFMVGIKINL